MDNSEKITIGGAIPPKSLDGMAPHHDDLIADPHRIRLVVCLMDVSGMGANFDREENWPIIRVRAWEPITNPEDRALGGEIMARAMAKRTGGQEPLPFEPGEVASPPETSAERRKREAAEDKADEASDPTGANVVTPQFGRQ